MTDNGGLETDDTSVQKVLLEKSTKEDKYSYTVTSRRNGDFTSKITVEKNGDGIRAIKKYNGEGELYEIVRTKIVDGKCVPTKQVTLQQGEWKVFADFAMCTELNDFFAKTTKDKLDACFEVNSQLTSIMSKYNLKEDESIKDPVPLLAKEQQYQSLPQMQAEKASTYCNFAGSGSIVPNPDFMARIYSMHRPGIVGTSTSGSSRGRN